jgi:lipoprotein-releasing system ATP-binding protein
VESLSKLYHSGGTEIIVFDDLSLEVSRGEQLAIVGESGAGKSTLMHLLGGLDRPSGGRIYYGEREIVSLSEKDLANFRNREIGFVWQNPSLLPEFTAAENVMMPLLIRGVTPELAQATAGERLREVGLWNRRTHRAGELSGGERQRVGLARALITGPGVLLADEPTGNLDFRTGELILDLLGNLHAAHALTSVIVTHNPGLASRCDRVLELKKGALHTLSVMELQEAGVVVQDATRLDGGTYV